VAKFAKVGSASASPPLHDRIGGQLLQAADEAIVIRDLKPSDRFFVSQSILPKTGKRVYDF
jgi:hypothetical protein